MVGFAAFDICVVITPQRVWASPSRRLMSDKGTSEEITYPNICFMLDNFDEVRNGINIIPTLSVGWHFEKTKNA